VQPSCITGRAIEDPRQKIRLLLLRAPKPIVSTPVVPKHGGTNRCAFAVNQPRANHNSSDADGCDVASLDAACRERCLEQEFNSLDNQREASEAYVKSQAHEGWKLIGTRYDDGGCSGGSMERPALQKLLMTFALAGSTWSSSIRSTG
jgi:hypothetical protein